MLGDRVAQALELVGLTGERVSSWLGAPCNCEGRRQKLNALDGWVRRVLSGKVEKAAEYLGRMLDDE